MMKWLPLTWVAVPVQSCCLDIHTVIDSSLLSTILPYFKTFHHRIPNWYPKINYQYLKYSAIFSTAQLNVGHAFFQFFLSSAIKWESPCQLCHKSFSSTPEHWISFSSLLYIDKSVLGSTPGDTKRSLYITMNRICFENNGIYLYDYSI